MNVTQPTSTSDLNLLPHVVRAHIHAGDPAQLCDPGDVPALRGRQLPVGVVPRPAGELAQKRTVSVKHCETFREQTAKWIWNPKLSVCKESGTMFVRRLHSAKVVVGKKDNFSWKIMIIASSGLIKTKRNEVQLSVLNASQCLRTLLLFTFSMTADLVAFAVYANRKSNGRGNRCK